MYCMGNLGLDSLLIVTGLMYSSLSRIKLVSTQRYHRLSTKKAAGSSPRVVNSGSPEKHDGHQDKCEQKVPENVICQPVLSPILERRGVREREVRDRGV